MQLCTPPDDMTNGPFRRSSIGSVHWTIVPVRSTDARTRRRRDALQRFSGGPADPGSGSDGDGGRSGHRQRFPLGLPALFGPGGALRTRRPRAHDRLPRRWSPARAPAERTRVVVAGRVRDGWAQRLQPRRALGSRSRRARRDRHRRRVCAARARGAGTAARPSTAAATSAARRAGGRRRRSGGAGRRANRPARRAVVDCRVGRRDGLHVAGPTGPRPARRVLRCGTHRLDRRGPTHGPRGGRRRIGVARRSDRLSDARGRLSRRGQRGSLRALVHLRRPHRRRAGRPHRRHHPGRCGPHRSALRTHHDRAECDRWLRVGCDRRDARPTTGPIRRPTTRDSRDR